MKPWSDPYMITLLHGLSSIHSLLLRKCDHSDMRPEVAIHQSNKNSRVPEIPNIQNHIILFKRISCWFYVWQDPKIVWVEMESLVITCLWVRYLLTKKSFKSQHSRRQAGWSFQWMTSVSCRSPSRWIQLPPSAPPFSRASGILVGDLES